MIQPEIERRLPVIVLPGFMGTHNLLPELRMAEVWA